MPFGWGVFEPSVSADGRLVAFRAAFDFVGQNPDSNFEIFLFDRESGLIAQLTQTSVYYGNFEPSITPDGSAVVFRSAFNYAGANADGSFELFEADIATGAIQQLTFFPATAMLTSPVMSGDGTCVAFLTSYDGTLDVWRYRRSSGQLIAVTNSPLGYTATQPAINGNGSRVAFLSKYNFDGSNGDNSLEVWRWTEGEGVVHVTQTSSAASNELPTIDGSGERVAFISRGNITGENPTATREVFLHDFARGRGASTVQITPSAVGGKHLEPVLSADGATVVFESDRDPVGDNPDKNRELFRFDVNDAELVQLTLSEGGAPISMMSESATKNYIAIAVGSGDVAYRSEHVLDPSADDPAPDVNLELFVGVTIPTLLGDLDLDGDVDEIDLGICLGEWGNTRSIADLDDDGIVGAADLTILLGSWT